MASIQELLEQKAALEAQIAQMQKAARADAIAKVKALMSEYGLTAEDLAQGARAPRKASAEGASSKVAPKYRNEAGDTWTGRGLKPKWLTAALASGKTLDDFKI